MIVACLNASCHEIRQPCKVDIFPGMCVYTVLAILIKGQVYVSEASLGEAESERRYFGAFPIENMNILL